MQETLASQEPTQGAEIPTHKLANETTICVGKTNRVLMRLRGALVLPVGAEIELPSPRGSVTVERVRLLTPTADGGAVTVCLEVNEPEGK